MKLSSESFIINQREWHWEEKAPEETIEGVVGVAGGVVVTGERSQDLRFLVLCSEILYQPLNKTL